MAHHAATGDPLTLEPAPLAMDDESLRRLEEEVRLATYARDLALLSRAADHYVRGSLNTISIYVGLLQLGLGDPGRQAEYLQVIEGEVRRCDDLLRELMRLTRPSSPGRLDLAATVQEIVRFLKEHGIERNVQVDWEPAPETMEMDAETDAIRHALVHLLLTALEEVPERGRLTVRMIERDGRAVVIASGAPSLDEVFRSDADGSDGIPLLGPGRGLLVARRVVERHHGTIHVRSGASRAATLEIELPLAAAEDR